MEQREHPGGEGDGALELELDSLAAARARLFRWPFAIPAFFSTPRCWVESSGGLACRGAVAVALPCSALSFDFPPQIVAEPWLSN